jgi:hypothetical protein
MYFRDLVKNRILIIGANGMLGQCCVDFYSNSNNKFELLSLSIEDQPVFNDVDYIP